MKKNSKMILGIILLCTCYAVLFYFLSGSYKATDGYIIISNLGGYYCKAKKCSYKTPNEINVEKKNMKVWQQNKYLGTYQMKYQDRWNFFQKDTWQKMYGDFLGISESLNAEVLEYRLEEFTTKDIALLKESLAEKEINNYNKLTNEYAYVFDFDGNGEEDRILATSNQNGEISEDKYFSTLLIVLNGKKNEVYFEVSEERDLPIYNPFSVLKLEEEKNPRILLNKGYYDNLGESSLMMLQVDGKKIKEVAGNLSK